MPEIQVTEAFRHQAGSARPPADIVAIHGFGASARVWQDLFAGQGNRYRVRAVTLPGHGGRPAPKLLTLGALVDTSVEKLTTPAVWLGWSLGGLVALSAAQTHPHLVHALVTVAIGPRFVSAPDWPNALPISALDAFEAELCRHPEAALGRFFALQTHTRSGPNATLTRRLKALALGDGPPARNALMDALCILRDTDLRAEAAALRCPHLVLLGSDDALVPGAVGDDLRRLNPDCRVEIIPDAGHVPFLSHASLCLQHLENFLRAAVIGVPGEAP
jgi:pimeloyl-[acyl-carrier protein] methyl ester esterase